MLTSTPARTTTTHASGALIASADRASTARVTRGESSPAAPGRERFPPTVRPPPPPRLADGRGLRSVFPAGGRPLDGPGGCAETPAPRGRYPLRSAASGR